MLSLSGGKSEWGNSNGIPAISLIIIVYKKNFFLDGKIV